MFRNLKIRTKIFWAFLITGFVLTAIGVVVFNYFSIKYIRVEVYNRLEMAAKLHADNIETFLEGRKEAIKQLSEGLLIKELLLTGESDEDYAQKLAKVTKRLKNTESIGKYNYDIIVLDKNGIVLSSSDETLVGKNKSDCLGFIEGKKDVFIRDVHLCPDKKIDTLTFIAPIYEGRNKDFIGVVAERLTTDKLNEITMNITGLGKTGETYLVNKDGYAITPLLFDKDAVLKKKVDSEQFHLCREEHLERGMSEEMEEIPTTYLDYRRKKVLGVHTYIPEMKWCLLTEIDEREVFSSLKWMFWIALGLAVFLLVVIYLMASWIGRRISKPIMKLNEGIKIVGKGDLDYRVGMKSKDEIGQLSRAFDSLVSHLKEAKTNIEKKVREQTKLISGQKEKLEKQQGTLLISLKDVQTEREKIAREKNKVSAILYSIGDGVFVIDRDYRITVFNQAAVNISGFSEKEVMGKKYNEVLKFVFESSGKINDGFIKKAISTGEVKELSNHAVLIRKDGKKIAVADSAAPLRNKNGKIVGCVVVFRDISRERRISQMESEFVSIASHQLRTPITAIQWLMERVLRKEKISKKGREYLNSVHASARRLNALVDLLLNVSKVEAGKINVSFREIEVIEIIERYLKERRELCAKKNITLIFKKHPKTLNVITDNNLFRNIIQSLVSNAIEYTPEKGKIEVSLEKKPKSFILAVSDTGIGIPIKEQATIFEKFTRASNAKLLKTDGTGLGLYFTEQVVKLLGGKIWFKSEENKGTTFYVELPLKLEKEVQSRKFV